VSELKKMRAEISVVHMGEMSKIIYLPRHKGTGKYKISS
jgi:hypothetical protein